MSRLLSVLLFLFLIGCSSDKPVEKREVFVGHAISCERFSNVDRIGFITREKEMITAYISDGPNCASWDYSTWWNVELTNRYITKVIGL
jgi:hypothetical protein